MLPAVKIFKRSGYRNFYTNQNSYLRYIDLRICQREQPRIQVGQILAIFMPQVDLSTLV